MTNYNERLDELLTELRSGTINFDDRAKQAILDWHNKQVEAVLDRLEDEKRYTNDTAFLQYDLVVVPLSAIEAERNKLNPSKSTPFNKLKEES